MLSKIIDSSNAFRWIIFKDGNLSAGVWREFSRAPGSERDVTARGATARCNRPATNKSRRARRLRSAFFSAKKLRKGL